ncbi:MAG: sugar phosphate isomerase/epimerase [Gammaproteobacteria bacterium]|nr:sugar phosphate isomerase/epimerase [Gammaproteobacteria bacterium]
MQTLRIYQSLWAMELRKPGVTEATMAENFQYIATAGFDGVCLDPSVAEIENYATVGTLCSQHNLDCMINAFPYESGDLSVLLKFAQEIHATMVNVIGGIMPLTPAEAVPIVRRWLDDAAVFDLPLLFETHRDSLLNDLFFTLQLIALVPEMRLCADLSHFVVDRELRLPIPDADRDYIQTILARSDCFQGRVASREQIQVQLDFPQHQPWVQVFRTWWKDGMRMWRKRNDSDAELIFLCELGPPPYAITDRHQNELSDRFAEALLIRQWVQEIWAELDAEE